MALVAGLDTIGSGTGSFRTEYGAGAARNSIASLMGDTPTNDNLGIGEDHDMFAGDRNDSSGSRDAADSLASGTGSSDNRTESAAVSRSSSNAGAPPGSALSNSENSGSRLDIAHAKPDANQDQVAGLGGGFLAVYGVASREVASRGPSNGLVGAGPSASGSTAGGITGDALGATTGNFTGQPPNGPLQANGPAGSEGGDPGPPSDLNGAGANPPVDQGSGGGLGITPVPSTGPVAAVPEPRSFVLLSLGLGGILLWRKFRPVG
jgi:hypothetical protein